jgi:hypothetical protein
MRGMREHGPSSVKREKRFFGVHRGEKGPRDGDESVVSRSVVPRRAEL